jgi:arylsulfatase
MLIVSMFFGSISAQKRPNIVLILADDMGYSDLGCYGGEIHTPNLDKLAANGLRFMQFYNGGRCCPTRASLLTGLYPHQAGIGQMNEDMGLPGYRGQLNRECVTIAEVLKTAGYKTYMTGKWHLTSWDPTNYSKINWPKQRGFDRFYGTIDGAGSYYDPCSLVNENELISPYNDSDYKPEIYYYTDAISDHATRFISEHDNQNPFFLYIAYTAPHWPMQALNKDIAKYKNLYDGGYAAIRDLRIAKMKALGNISDEWKISPRAGKSWEEIENKEWEARGMEVYAAMIDNMDQGIGRIINELERKGILDNTLVMFLSDNGGNWENYGRTERLPVQATIRAQDLQNNLIPDVTRDNIPVMMGQDVMPGGPESFISYSMEWGNVSNTPFRMFKSFVHEGGISTPLIAYWPEGIKQKNEWRQSPGHLIDIMATCIELGGATYPTVYNGTKIIPLEGQSLVPVFKKDESPDRFLFFEHLRGRAVRDKQWKLVSKKRGGAWELYNIISDRTEMNNLIDQKPELAKVMMDAWEAWALKARVKPFPEIVNK